MKKLAQVIGSALLLSAITFAATSNTPSPAMALQVFATKSLNATGIYASAGQQFTIATSSGGRVNLDPDNGGITMDPTGTITFAPVSTTGTYGFYESSCAPLGTPPAVGGQKYAASPFYSYLPSAPLGALVGGWSPNPTPAQPSDFPSGFFLVGLGTTTTAPSGGGFLFLVVNDNVGYNGGSLGDFGVTITGPLAP